MSSKENYKFIKKMSKKSKQLPEILDQDKLIAFQMKFEGYTYEQIAEKTKVTANTLMIYLRPNGKWYPEYREWVSAMTRDLNEQVKDMFTAQALKAMQRVINFAHGIYEVAAEGKDGKPVKVRLDVKDVTALKANQDILDRAGFKPPETIAFEAESKAEEAARWFEEQEEKQRAVQKNAK